MRRGIVLAMVVALTGVSSAFSAWLFRSQRACTTRADVEPARLAEVAVARAAGLVPIEETTVRGDVARSLPVPAGECIALVASVSGREDFRLVQLRVGGELVSGTNGGDHVAHLATCATDDAQADVRLELSRVRSDWEGPPGEITFAILRGRVADLRAYRRLSLSAQAAVRLATATVRDRESRAVTGGTRLGAARDVHVGVAVLLPASDATHAGARALLGEPGLVPALDGAGEDPFATSEDRTVPARAHTPAGLARLLAVVDAGALGAPCVAVTFARLDEPSNAEPIRRIELPSLVETPVPALDRAIAVDRFCPARGLYAYVTDDRVAADVAVATYATEASADARAEPSSFRATTVQLPEVAAARASCGRDEPEGCMRLAGYAAAGVTGAGEPMPPLEHACDGGSAEACDRLASLLEGRAADALERRACAGGWTIACLRRAGRFLAGARDLRAAYATYRFACTVGDASACEAARTMTDWQLADDTIPAATAETLP